MFKKLKVKSAKKHDAKKLKKLFSEIDENIEKEELEKLIREKRVYVMKDKKDISAAFIYTLVGITGLFSFMWLRKLAVKKEIRKKGLGSILLGFIKKFSVKKGAAFLFIYSLSKAKKFYTKNKLSNLWRWFWWKKNDKK